MKLSSENFAKARHFIKTQGRKLDWRLFEFYFENGSAEAVLAELARYQNDDGGFGQALEPDFRLPTSSILATTVGLQVIRALKITADQPMVQKAIAYLIANYDPIRGYWEAVPEPVNQVAHAPWWHYEEKTVPESPANPTAEVVGYLHAYASLVPPDFLEKRTQFSIEHIEYLDTLPDTIGMHDLLCYLRMVAELAGPLKTPVLEKLKRAVSTTVTRTPEAWLDYGPQPLTFVTAPDSPFYDELHEEIETNLDFLIAQQKPDGSWQPNWSWGDNYPDEWPIAKQEWAGHITVGTLKTLWAYNRISLASISSA